jgi:hypothetical protein
VGTCFFVSDVALLAWQFNCSSGAHGGSNWPCAGTLSITGNLVVSGGFLPHHNGTIRFTGTGTRTLGGNAFTFYNVYVGSGSTVFTYADVTLVAALTNNGLTRETTAVPGTGPIHYGLASDSRFSCVYRKSLSPTNPTRWAIVFPSFQTRGPYAEIWAASGDCFLGVFEYTWTVTFCRLCSCARAPSPRVRPRT